MAGLFGFFGKKNNDQNGQKGQNDQNGDASAFFLDPDQARTFGDIDYMRSTKSVRRSFPKTVGNGGKFEQTRTTSSLEGKSSLGSTLGQTETNGSASAAQNSSQGSDRRRGNDSSMDLFRNMARDMKKR